MDLFFVSDEITKARGYNIYKNKLIKNVKKIDDNKYEAIVSGTNDYNVQVDIENINKSKCSCPNKKKICKHIIALCFELDSDEAYVYEQSLKELIADQKKYNKHKKEEYTSAYNNAVKYVDSLSIDEVKKELVSRIIDENIYNDPNDFDYYDEEEFEILDEIDDDILKSLDNDILDDDSYPVHKLEDYIEAFVQIQGEESYIDLRTCEVYDDNIFESMDMDDDEIEEFLYQPYVTKLPGLHELDEYSDMLTFIDSIDDSNIQEILFRTVNGKGAFRRFKLEIDNLNLRTQWFKHKYECLRYKVIRWLEENDIKYIK